MPINKILIADDEELIRGFLKSALERNNYEITLVEDGSDAIELLQREHFDLIITDMRMKKKSGLDLLKVAKEMDPNIIVIIMTAFGTVEDAVSAIHLGAFNYIIKPFSIETLEAIIKKAEEHYFLFEENQYYRKEALDKFSNIIHESIQMKKILKDLEKIAKSDVSVFINGESGTGKEVLASAIHNLSLRSKKPFIKVNCAAITETLLESEFFGHEKGSFTGAEQKKTGRFELADSGTLLLDEVTEIPILLQPKLLRAVQEQEFERVGGIKPIKVNIRFISTSNRDMQEAISNNFFREDLYFRLNVIPINIPPLRERKEDIIPLAKYYLDLFAKKYHKKVKMISERARDKLLSYPWPGNIRELANIIERAVVLDLDEILEINHLNLECEKDCEIFSLEEMEKKHILKILKEMNNNKSKTAEKLKISLRTLRNKLKSYQL